MRSELFRIPIELLGVPLLGVGVLLLVWIVVAGALLIWHLRAAGENRDVGGYLVPALLGAAAILFLPRFFPEGLPIRGYGVMLLVAVSTGLAMAVHRARQHGIHPDTIFSLAFWMFIFGIAGARLFFVIEYWETRFGGQPLGETIADVLRFTEGGLVVYGSLIGAGLAFAVFTYRHQLPMIAMADLLSPSLAAGLAIGRIGCLLNGCCYGGQSELPWAVTFPQESPPFVDQLVHGELHGVKVAEVPNARGGTEARLVASPSGKGQGERIVSANGASVRGYYDVAAAFGTGREVTLRMADGTTETTSAVTRRRSLPVHPTQIYSSINAGLLAWFLWSWYPSRRRDGEVVLLLLTIYPVSRFLLEIIRTDEAAIFGTGLSISQNVSLGMLAVAAVGWGLWFRSKKTLALGS